MTLMPTLLLDLTHILAAEAIRQDAFEAGYHTVNEILSRPQLDGTGLEKPPRPYFLRIGAGANFEDKGMPASLKCRILSHTEKVHNQSYQSIRIRQDMQGAAFGDLAGENEQLFRHLDHVWKDFDPSAPIYMTEAQRLEMESRKDTTALVQQLSALREAKGAPAKIQNLTHRLVSHRKRLEELAILARREAYFRDKARFR
ncbi:hypothetical protein VPNG_10379 [Cytospora leucostoma]|uniref:Uncharacterized protein n=1 Tax=Cytospora leucostoma TaxID=1230097 RepID=A0A423VCI3_9PEZI|nr:hypothetical protein VPNG_10379 [Cytospora leucostoma]